MVCIERQPNVVKPWDIEFLGFLGCGCLFMLREKCQFSRHLFLWECGHALYVVVGNWWESTCKCDHKIGLTVGTSSRLDPNEHCITKIIITCF